jgi:hypothetical protein
MEMNKRYVAALGIAALVILVLGAWFRPKPHTAQPKPAEAQAAPVPPPSRRGQMRQISDFLSERAQESADHLVYVASAQATGIVWTTGQVVTVAPGSALVQTAAVTPSTEPAPVTLAPTERFGQTGWIVVVARGSDGALVSSSGLLGSSADATCGSTRVRKLMFNVPLDAALAGGGVFDVSGDLLGQVIKCGESWMAVTHTTIQRLLEQQLGADAVAWHDFGVRLHVPTEEERSILRVPATGLFVAEVRRSSRAFNMGLRPGDVLLKTGDEDLEQPEDILALGDTITIWRNRRQVTLPVVPHFSVDEPVRGALLTSVQPGTRLHEAGLQPGDRILEPRPAELNRLLAGKSPVWVTFDRDDRRIGVLVR